MDNLYTILLVGLFLFITFRQDSKNKQKKRERMLNQQQEEQPEEPITRPFERAMPDKIEPRPLSTHKPIFQPPKPPANVIAARKAYAAKLAAEKANNSNKRAKQSIQSPSNKTSKPISATQPTETNKPFEFDMERAVIESEILKPKYLEY